MKCYVCAVETGVSNDALAICQTCGVGLCIEHFDQTAKLTNNESHYPANHRPPSEEAKQLAKDTLRTKDKVIPTMGG